MAEDEFDEIYQEYNYFLISDVNKNPPFSLFGIDILNSEDIQGAKDVELEFDKNILTLYDAKLYEKVKKGYVKRNLNSLNRNNDFIFLGFFYDNNYKIKILDEQKETFYIIESPAVSLEELVDLEEFEKNLKEEKEDE